jgi:hypothetical protein
MKVFNGDHTELLVLSACNEIDDGTDQVYEENDQRPDPFRSAGMFAADEVNQGGDHQNQLDDHHWHKVWDEWLNFREVHNAFPFDDVVEVVGTPFILDRYLFHVKR